MTLDITVSGKDTDVLQALDAISRVLSFTGGDIELPNSDGTVRRIVKAGVGELPGTVEYDFTKHPNQPVLPELLGHINASLWLFNELETSGVMPETEWLKELRVFHKALQDYIARNTE